MSILQYVNNKMNKIGNEFGKPEIEHRLIQLFVYSKDNDSSFLYKQFVFKQLFDQRIHTN